ncbi:DUF1127 domain-containing protein [Leisingera sp. ANG-M6]|uniref:DUF1127 domain-containing protein n=1 Tax=Leisingera sp. ANG-M6 TaxID=1577900 RepID=UPI00057EECE0|nr:DUF1127 domain-containing protein [Leisingera sp. ANG-M6]KIC29268.1 hypothetical protein RA24_06550 [Leisingera sp. ANG-M6]
MTLATSACTTSCHRVKPQLSLTARLRLHLAAWRQRRQLSRLDDRALEDIGVTRAQADAEARGGFWRAPDHWSF